MMKKYRRWKERTSTSPSGRHLGHFHALFRPLKAKDDDDDDDRNRLEGIRIALIEMNATILQTAYDNEHVYERCEYILTCIIELHVERAHTDRQTIGINHSEEHARVIPFTASQPQLLIH
jgi:hypothetical protein